MKNIILLGLILFVGTSFAQDKKPKTRTIEFKTTAICEACKERIEDELNYTKGIVFAELDLDTKIVQVKFKTKFMNEDRVKAIVANIGYNAGDTKRNEDAFNKLPKCCRIEGECKE